MKRDHSPRTVDGRYRRSSPEISLAGMQLHELPAARLYPCVEEIVRIESPIHTEELTRRVVDAAGLQRIGNRVREAVHRAVALGVGMRRIVRRGAFVWMAGQTGIEARDRSELHPESRNIHFVPPEEIRAALLQAVPPGSAVSPREAVTRAARALGFHRLSTRTRRVMDEHLATLVGRGELQSWGGSLVTAGAVEPELLRASA